MSLFGDGPAASDGEEDDLTLPPVEEWTHSQQLAFEKEVFGFYLTSHPLTEFADEVAAFAQNSVKELRDLDDGKEVVLGGMIASIKKAQTKNPSRNGNSKYVNFDLEDATGAVRCIMWPDDYANDGEKVEADTIVILRGRVDSRGREPNIIINKLFTIGEAEKEFTRQVALFLRRGFHTEDDMKRAREILNRFPGKTPVVLVVDTMEDEPAGKNGNGQSPEGNGDNGQNDSGHSAGGNGNGKNNTGGRLRAILSTSIQVSARPELRKELRDALGENWGRFQGANGN